MLGDQWGLENGANTGDKITLTMPKLNGQTSNVKVQLNVLDGYYPVAIYEAGLRGNSRFIGAGTH